MRASTRNFLVLISILVVEAPLASAGLIYDWVSLEVLEDGTIPSDPASVAGQVRLRNGVGLDEIAHGDDVAYFGFTDPLSDSWRLDDRLVAQMVTESAGLGLGDRVSAKLKEGFMTLSTPPRKGDTVKALSFSTLTPKTPPPPTKSLLPLIPDGVDLWYWELTFRPESSKDFQLLYTGSGYWSRSASSPVPEPATVFLLVGGAAIVRARHRRA